MVVPKRRVRDVLYGLYQISSPSSQEEGGGTVIKHKIRAVSDELCHQCFQHWDGECRAYEMAHSREEYLYRVKGDPLCTYRRKGDELYAFVGPCKQG